MIQKTAIILLMSFSTAAYSQLNLSEIKCAEDPFNKYHYDIHLKPSAEAKYNFKRCHPGYDIGLKCTVFADSTCEVDTSGTDQNLTISARCERRSFKGEPVELVIKALDEWGRHAITIQVGFEEPRYFGTNYFCRAI